MRDFFKKFWQEDDFLYNAWAFRKYAGVAQWLESLPSKQTVVGSSPIARSTSFESILFKKVPSFLGV